MTNKNNTRILLGAITALGASALWVPSAFGVTYTTVQSATQLDWNSAASWTGGAGGTPGSAAADTAIVSGAFGGVAQTVDISTSLTAANGLTALTLGDTSGTGTTTIQTSNSSSLALANNATITSAGSAGAINRITAPITLAGNFTIAASTNDLSIAGKLTPSAAANRTITNSSTKTVTFGDIDISTSTTTAILTITNSNTAGNKIVLGGTIANGSSVAANVTYSASLNSSGYEITGSNTYTGNTALGGNAQYIIGSNSAFGLGNITSPASSGQTTTFSASGGDRIIPNGNVTLARNNVFSGSNSLSFSGTVTAGTGFAPTNNISGPGKQIVFNGRFNTTSSTTDDARQISVAGNGTTVFNGTLADAPSATVDQYGSIAVTGATGKVIINGTATLQGDFRISSGGTVQLGNGGTTGVITPANPKNALDTSMISSVVTGGANTTGGFLAVNRSDAVTLGSTMNGKIGLNQIGSGTVTVASPQFNTGSNQVGDGTNLATLVVTAGVKNASTQAATINAPAVKGGGYNVFFQTITVPSTSGLVIGQPVYIGAAGSAAPIYIHEIVNATTLRLWGTGVASGTGLPTGTGTSVNFGAGSSLGSDLATTTVNNNATLAGIGTISGSVTGLAGSRFAPGVNISGNFGNAGTLTTGALSLTGSTLDFDLAATVAGASDFIASTGSVTFSSLSFNFNALTGSVLETGSAYHLVSVGDSFTGDASLIGTTFGGGLQGLYIPTYSINGSMLDVTFAAVPEPSSFGLLAGMAALGGCLVRRRRRA